MFTDTYDNIDMFHQTEALKEEYNKNSNLFPKTVKSTHYSIQTCSVYI